MGFEHIGVLIGVLTFLGGLLAWYRGAVEKNYASKRDWEHVRRNQENLTKNLETLFREFDNRFDQTNNQLLELKGMFYASLTKNRHLEDRRD